MKVSFGCCCCCRYSNQLRGDLGSEKKKQEDLYKLQNANLEEKKLEYSCCS